MVRGARGLCCIPAIRPKGLGEAESLILQVDGIIGAS